MLMTLKIFPLFLLSILGLFGVEKTFVPYEPEVIILFGTLSERIYPGPPNYTSIENGDAPESVLILKLPQPIQVGNPDTEPRNQPEKDVLEIQLTVAETLPPSFNNQHFLIKGSLFHAFESNHHTLVVMMPTEIIISPTHSFD